MRAVALPPAPCASKWNHTPTVPSTSSPTTTWKQVAYVHVHDLPRRAGGRQFLIYDVDVEASHRRRGVARALMAKVAELARERGIAEGFVLTEPDNDPANGLYEQAGGLRSEVVMWDFSYTDD